MGKQGVEHHLKLKWTFVISACLLVLSGALPDTHLRQGFRLTWTLVSLIKFRALTDPYEPGMIL